MPSNPTSGEARVWALTAAFPEQLKGGLAAVPSHRFAVSSPGGVLVAGMGGSGIAGELLASVASESGEHPLFPVRDFRLPSWAKPPLPAVFVSYSGTTAETLSTYEEARRLGLPRAVIASGGPLLEMARKDSVLAVEVPGGQPPRASLGFLLGALAGVLRYALPSAERDLPLEIGPLTARGRELANPSGPSARIVSAWEGKGGLWTYASDLLLPVARRWKTQLEENAKVHGHFDSVPELLHNAIVAWDVLSSREAASSHVALLRSRREGTEVARRMDYLKEALGKKGVEVFEVASKAGSFLGEVLDLTWTGDYVSLWAARKLGVDPLPVPGIDRMKASLGPTATASVAPPRPQ